MTCVLSGGALAAGHGISLGSVAGLRGGGLRGVAGRQSPVVSQALANCVAVGSRSLEPDRPGAVAQFSAHSRAVMSGLRSL